MEALHLLHAPITQGHTCFVSLMLSDPADAFRAFLAEPYPVLLDSAADGAGGGWGGGYSFLAADPFLVLKSRGKEAWVEVGNRRRPMGSDPFSALRQLLTAYATPSVPGLPLLQGGAIGYLG